MAHDVEGRWHERADWGKIYAVIQAVYGLNVGDLTYAQVMALLENLADCIELKRGL